MYVERKDCRICGNKDFNEVLNLGKIYPSSFVDGEVELEKVPLVLVQCKECELVQLLHTVDLDLMYRHYWYKSGLNSSMVQSLKDVVESVENRVELKAGDVVIDIGCNDGTMLSMYQHGLYKVGIDPALNLAEEATKHCDLFINDYFDASSLPPRLPKAKVITAIAVFYDLDDPKGFLTDIKKSLAPDGLFVVQFMDLSSMLKTNGFDNICHEHLEYYSLRVLMNLLNKVDLMVADIDYEDTNGGSLRLYIKHWSPYVAPTYRVGITYMHEASYINNLNEFTDRVELIKETVTDYVRSKNNIAVLGASTKGNTTLQYLGLTNKDIDHAAEINEEKFGKRTVGSDIPIISQEESLKRNPEVYLVLPWHFLDNFLEKLGGYLDSGGELLIPMPEPVAITKKDGKLKWTYFRKQPASCWTS